MKKTLLLSLILGSYFSNAQANEVQTWPEAFMEVPFAPADSFQTKQRGKKVFSLAKGQVREVDEQGLWTEHLFYENHERFILLAHIALTDAKVKKGEKLFKKSILGTRIPAENWHLYVRKLASTERFDRILQQETSTFLSFEVQDIRAFLRKRRTLFVPQHEKTVLLIEQKSRTLVYIKDQKIVKRIRVGFGQVPGKKVRQGDKKSPRGMYFVMQKYRGKFNQPYGEYYGGHWIKLNYPNAFDAERGLAQGWINKRQAQKMSRIWRKRKLPWAGSRLGGGIGLHGWAEEWSNEDPWLSFGCIVLHNSDVQKLYDHIPMGTMVILM